MHFNKFTFLLLILFSSFLSCNSVPKDTLSDIDWVKKNADGLMLKKYFSASNGLKLPYRLFMPSVKNKKKIPLIIYLHGRGERGSENGARIFNSAGIVTNDKSLLLPKMQIKYSCAILIPQCSDKTENEEWAKWEGNTPQTPFEGLGKDGSYVMNKTPSESGEAALELIEKSIKTLNIDPERVYIIGLSMGGFGVWEFVSRKPNLFAAAIPMAGYSDPNQIEVIKHIPFWIFHGNIDKWNPVEGSRTMFKLLKEVQADVKYSEYDNFDHGETFKRAFNEPELISWLFSKSKKQ